MISSIYATNTFVIDLSKPPTERWSQIVQNYTKEDLRAYAKSIDQNIKDTIPVLKSQLARKILNSIGWHVSRGGETDQWFDEMHQELQGLSDALKQRMDGESLNGFREEDLFLLNIGYDFSTYCTTGVYIDILSSHPSPVLFRNLDWNIDLFKKFAFEGVFTKNGQELFKSVSFLGQIGILTGVKPNAFAIALNYRKTNKKDYIFENEVLANLKSALLDGGWANSMLIRYSLEHDNSYEQAKSRFVTTKLIAPSYLTLAGTNLTQALIIERGRESAHNQRSFDNIYENKNFLVQTNHDMPIPAYHNEDWAENDPLLSEKSGMGTIKRRDTAISYLNTLVQTSSPLLKNGQTDDEIQFKLLYMLTSVTPVFNQQTIFSAVMNPASGNLNWQVSK